ncbi:MAG: S16 family serine protease [Planctomycetota bacterium]
MRSPSIMICLLAAAVLAGGGEPGAYTGPDLSRKPFVPAATCLTPGQCQETALLLAMAVRSNQIAVTDPARFYPRALGIALTLHPENKPAYIANEMLKKGMSLTPVEGEKRFDNIVDGLRATIDRLTTGGSPGDLKCAACLNALILMLKPGDEDAQFALLKYEEAGPLDWSWAGTAAAASAAAAPAAPPASAAVPAAGPGTPAAPVVPPLRTKGQIKGLMVIPIPDGTYAGGVVSIFADVALQPPAADKAPVHFAAGDYGKDMQICLEGVSKYLIAHHPQAGQCSIEITFGDKYSSKDGPSAGMAFTVLLLSLFQGFEIDKGFAVTGDITPDGKSGDVGAVAGKIEAAVIDKAVIVGIPFGDVSQLSDVVLLYSRKYLYEVQIFSVATVDDAVALARTDRPANISRAIALFGEVQETARKDPAFLKNQVVLAKLGRVMELAPHHASALWLLNIANGKGPQCLTLSTSLSKLFLTTDTFNVDLYQTKSGDQVSRWMSYSRQDIDRTVKELGTLKKTIHPDIESVLDAYREYLKGIVSFQGLAPSVISASHLQNPLTASICSGYSCCRHHRRWLAR